MRFYFIRHAQSANNLLWERTGSSQGRSHDPQITDLGRQQAARLAEFLTRPGFEGVSRPFDEQDIAGFSITHLYTSLMQRAVETANIVAEALDLPLYAWEDLHESGGIYLDDETTGEPVGLPGMGRSHFQSHFPRLVLPDSVTDDGWWNRPYEALEQRPLRARRVLNDLLTRHGGTEDSVAIISHGGFYNRFLTALLNLQPYLQENSYWFVLNNVAITRIDFGPEEVRLIYMNRLGFLPPDMIT
jgi:2,3-bisphosphoglycerate-dependent phosphoglycerate mutase